MDRIVEWLNDYVGWDPLTNAAAAIYLALPDDVTLAVVGGAAAVILLGVMIQSSR